MRLMAGVLGAALIGLGPVLLGLLVFVVGVRLGVMDALRMVACLGLSAVGVLLVMANRPDWLVIVLDADGLVLRRGRREWNAAWAEIAMVEATTRPNGRSRIPTVRVGRQGEPDLFLDDVFTLRPKELATALRQRCNARGNMLVQAAPTAAARSRPARRLMYLLLIPVLGLLIVAGIVLSLPGLKP